MKKLFKDMTEEEQIAFANELGRMYMHGAACLHAAAKNANEEVHGWPLITVYDSGNVTETPICDALEVLLEASKHDITKNVNLFTIVANGEAIIHAAIHQALHDAFCLGIAAVTQLEMDFDGASDLLDTINTAGNDDNDSK